MEKKSKVFVLNLAGHDISDAKRFGEPIIMSEGTINVFATDRLKDQISKTLKEHSYNSGSDYFVLSGSPILAFLLGLIIGQSEDEVKFLIWNSKDDIKKYVPRTIKLKQRSNDNE